jgi:hypothetical protein
MREFLENFAQDHGFDPLEVEKWYSFTGMDIEQIKVRRGNEIKKGVRDKKERK